MNNKFRLQSTHTLTPKATSVGLVVRTNLRAGITLDEFASKAREIAVNGTTDQPVSRQSLQKEADAWSNLQSQAGSLQL